MRVRSSFVRPLLFTVACLATAACAGPAPIPTPVPTATPTPTPAPPAVRVSLPRDDAPHPASNTEWWYYNGHLATADGRSFSFHYAVFQIAAQGGLFADVAHVAVTDATAGSFLFDQRGTLGKPATGAGGFAFDLDGWTMSGGGGRDRLAAGVEGFAFDLELTSLKPAVLHDGSGLVDFGEAGASYYYSRTRMVATGSVTLGERPEPVTGIAWFDHQWGDFEAQAIGWDWFALQMDDGVDVMLTVMRDAEGREIVRYGTMVSPDGVATGLSGRDFSVAASGSWTSPASGAAYPVGWIVRLPARGLDLTLSPVVEAAEFEAEATTGNFYWEGPVEVAGGGGGVGFVELTGYAPMQFPELEASSAGGGAE